jgi:hypothetical protein
MLYILYTKGKKINSEKNNTNLTNIKCKSS